MMDTDTYISTLRAEAASLSDQIRTLEDQERPLRERAAAAVAEFQRLAFAANPPEQAGALNEEQALLTSQASLLRVERDHLAARMREIERLVNAPEREQRAAERVRELDALLADARQRAARVDEVLSELDASAQREREAAEAAARAEVDALLGGAEIKAAKPKPVTDNGVRVAALVERRSAIRAEVAAIEADLRDAHESLAGARADVGEIADTIAKLGAARILADAEIAAEGAGIRTARSRIAVEIPDDVLDAAREAARQRAGEGAARV